MVKDVVLTGKFEGDLKTLGCLTVSEGGEMTGTVEAGALVLEPGHQVEARIKIAVSPLPKPEESAKRAAAGGSSWSGHFQKLKKLALGRK